MGVFAVALVGLGVVLPCALVALSTYPNLLPAQAALRATWSTLFVGAGLLRLVTWRLTGSARSGLLGCALVCFGLLSAPAAAIGPLMQSGARQALLSPMTRTVAVAICLLLVARALSSKPVDAGLRPGRIVGGSLLGALVLFSGILVLHRAGAPLFDDMTWLVVSCLLAVGWLALAARAMARGLADDDAALVWLALGLAGLGIAELLRAVAFVGPMTASFYATALQLVVGGLIAANASADLGVVLAMDGNRMLALTGALTAHERRIAAEAEVQANRAHDARSILAALKATTHMLDRYGERLDDEHRVQLRAGLVTEVARLEQLLAQPEAAAS